MERPYLHPEDATLEENEEGNRAADELVIEQMLARGLSPEEIWEFFGEGLRTSNPVMVDAALRAELEKLEKEDAE